MRKGHDISFNNLNSSIQLKQLNDVIDYLLTSIESRLDLNNSFIQYIYFGNATVNIAGEWKDMIFDKTFNENPIIIAYSPSGDAVITRQNPQENDMKEKIQVSFGDTTKTGNINVVAIGKVRIKY